MSHVSYIKFNRNNMTKSFKLFFSINLLYICFFSYVKDFCSDSSAKNYQKKKASKRACERYEDVSEEEKSKIWEYGHEWYKHLKGSWVYKDDIKASWV